MNNRALLAGPVPLVLTVSLPPPAMLSDEGWMAAGLGLFMAIWWMTEAVPLAVTALLPVALWPILTGTRIEPLLSTYADPMILLFLGGFLLAKGIEKSGLPGRVALLAVSLSGSDQRRTLAGIMGLTAFLSLWVSNTAAAVIMAPVAAAVAGTDRDPGPFGTTLMLGVAYAATIGGMGSIIGTPPNAIFAAYMRDAYGLDVGFATWAAFGLPVACTLLAVTYRVLIRSFAGLPDRLPVRDGGTPAPATSAAEKRVLWIAGCTAVAWIFRPLVEVWTGITALSDPGIAIIAAVSLFVVPAGDGRRLLAWDDAASIRWDILILVGGGLALARLLDETGLVAWIGMWTREMQWLPVPLLIVLFAGFVVLLGELASNTAMAAIFLPLAGATALAMGLDPLLFAAPIALAASIGFMLPVATPPNAIVFGQHGVTRQTMLRAGAPLDALGIIIAAGLGPALAMLVF